MVNGALEEIIYVTHIIRRPPESDGWCRPAYFTQKEGEQPYYFGWEFLRPLTREEIDWRVNSGTVVPLSEKVQIKRTGQSLWLTQENELYLADEKDPIGDKQKKLIMVL